jgi:hypothetical protein
MDDRAVRGGAITVESSISRASDVGAVTNLDEGL